MKNESTLKKKEVVRIIEHMNEDHEDALISYVQFYGKIQKCNNAKIIDLDSKRMRINYLHNSKVETVSIKFDHSLASAHDAHMTMVKMAKLAKRNLGN